MRNNFLVFGKPYFEEDDINEVVSTLRSGWWGTGPKTELFEKKFSKYVGSRYAIGLNSATAGLHLALKVMGVSSGDEVITTPLTFVSTVNSIIHCGAIPIFADIDKNDWNIDPKEIEGKISKRTKVILPVHLHGRPCKMDQIMGVAKKHHLFVLEDAAHAAEARFMGKKIGNIGDITVFSFYVTKNLATGEGGMITTNNKKWKERINRLKLHGLSQDAWKRYSVRHFTLYEAVEPGFKYNLTDIASSLGIHQLSRIEKNLKKRQEIWKLYDREFSGENLLTRPAAIARDIKHAMHLYAILLDIEKLKISRNGFVDKLIKLNIGSGVHFSPVHLHPYFKKTFGFKKGDYPNSEYVGERIISLPLGANLTLEDIKDVVNAVRKIIKDQTKRA